MITRISCVNRCCCFSLGIGSKIIGLLELIYAISIIYGSTVQWKGWYQTFEITFFSIFLICVCAYLIAIYLRMPNIVFCFGIVYISAICAELFTILVFATAKATTLAGIMVEKPEDLQLRRMSVSITAVLVMLARIYFALVIFSYAVELEEDEEY